MDLSVIIPARNEEFLSRTVDDILEHARCNTEVIAICDGNWPDPPVNDYPRLTMIYHPESIGQRAAVNEGARMSTARFIMKADAHCSFAPGFDEVLMSHCRNNYTVIPMMRNLHAFNWICDCGKTYYQANHPGVCECGSKDLIKDIIWKPRRGTKTYSYRFDKDLRFQYWRGRKSGDTVVDTMCFIGACWMMRRERHFELGGLDENHGSWGQVGVEVSLKTWLSGGRLVVDRNTWFAHMFRTNNRFSWPYPMSGNEVSKARNYSKSLWNGNKWDKAVNNMDWLINKFSPVPDWHSTKGIVYYTDNHCDNKILQACRKQILICAQEAGIPFNNIVSVSQQPIDFARNIVMDLPGRSVLSLYKQVLEGLKASTADIIFLCEHDLLYHPSHFDFTPSDKDIFYYDRNQYNLDPVTTKAVFYHSNDVSMLCADRDLLIKHYTQAVEFAGNNRHSSRYGFSPPRGIPKEIREGKARSYMAKHPTIDIRHNKTYTRKRMDKKQFRSERSCRGWTETYDIPWWGRIGDFNQFINKFITD